MKQKINRVEFVFVVLLVLMAEIAEGLMEVFLPVLGQVINVFWSSFVWLTIQFYLKIREARGVWYFVGSLVDYIPYINVLPIKTVSLIATIIIHNREAAVEASGGHSIITTVVDITNHKNEINKSKKDSSDTAPTV